MSQIAVFLDRDGTINEEMGYINHLDRFVLLPRTTKAIRLFNKLGLKVIVVTNQAGLAKGYFDEELLNQVHHKMERLLAKGGAHLDGIYYCPHHPEAVQEEYRKNCDCRKPNIGLIKWAAQEHGVDPRRSYMVGDKIEDVEFGKRAGAKGIMVLTGYGRGQWEHKRHTWTIQPDYVAEDLYDAAQWIARDLRALNSGTRVGFVNS